MEFRHALRPRSARRPGARGWSQHYVDGATTVVEIKCRVRHLPPSKLDRFQIVSVRQTTGLNDQRITDIARDNLRIAAYIDQRFGITVQVSDEEVANYYRTHEAEFTRGGETILFEDAVATARQRASNERRRAIIDQWIRDLRTRADVALNPATASAP